MHFPPEPGRYPREASLSLFFALELVIGNHSDTLIFIGEPPSNPPPQEQVVAEPARREEAGRAAVPLDDGVGDECRAVHDGAQVGEGGAGRSERPLEPLEGAG